MCELIGLWSKVAPALLQHALFARFQSMRKESTLIKKHAQLTRDVNKFGKNFQMRKNSLK